MRRSKRPTCRTRCPASDHASCWTWGKRRAALFYLWLVGFTVANVINRCAPGWCDTTGLPLPWRSGSDAIITINGTNVSAVMAGIGGAIGGAVNLLTFVAVAGVLTHGVASVRVRRPDGAGP